MVGAGFISANSEGSSAGFANQAFVHALEENLWSLWANFGLGPDCALHETGETLYFDTPILALPYNAVMRFSVKDHVDERIAAILDHYQERGMPVMWVVHPTAQPSDLGQRLMQHGLLPVEAVSGMVARLADLPAAEPLPEGVEIREVTTDDLFPHLFDLIAWRRGVAGDAATALDNLNAHFHTGQSDGIVRCWMAWRDGIPAAKAVLHIGGGAAGLHGVATRPDARRRGLARALTLEVFRAAQESGQRLGVLHASHMAEHLYSTLGFRALAQFHVYASSARKI